MHPSNKNEISRYKANVNCIRVFFVCVCGGGKLTKLIRSSTNYECDSYSY